MYTWLRPRRAISLVALALSACSDATAVASPASNATASSARTSRPRQEGSVVVADGVRLHYIDYGGSGEPLVLLAGLGNTAHVFETFAPRLTHRFRVIALTRRGFGASSQPLDGYDTRTLSEDVRIVLDNLGLTRVHLVGHSVAGDEMTRFAGDYPDRVGQLVYLDAAYDRRALNEALSVLPTLPPPAPTLDDISSLEAVSRYIERLRGVRIPDAEVRATLLFAPDGSVVGEVTPPEVSAAIIVGEERPDYSRVRAPALGIYAVATTPSDVFPWITPASPEWPTLLQLLTSVIQPAYQAQRERFDDEVANSRIVELSGANHYVFLSDPGRVAGAIISFLSSSRGSVGDGGR